MNKLWIEHSYYDAILRCEDDPLIGIDKLAQFEYLDVMGLYETSWMVYEHEKQAKDEYGYPNNE